MTGLQIFLLLYLVVVSLLYVYATKGGGEVPWLLPGDFYIHKGTKRIYIPLGSSLIITIILFLILNGLRNKIL